MDLTLVLKAVTAIAPVIALLLVFDRLDIFNLIALRTIGLMFAIGGALAMCGFLANWTVLEGFPIGFGAYTRYGAPAIEESLKAAPIIYLFATNRVGFKLDAAIAGFAVGAGFSVVENSWYLITLADTNFSAWLVRGFGTAIMHGGATAIFAAVSHEMSERQVQDNAARYRFNPMLFLPGLAIAYVVHAAFNHFPNQPALVMALTLLFVPLTLFVTFSRSERATHQWLKSDAEAHRIALAALRDGGFSQSEMGQAITMLCSKLNLAIAADVHAYLVLKTELVLRAEEFMLSIQDGQDGVLSLDDREKITRLDHMEQALGRGVLAAIAPHLAFSRNDLWELEKLKARARTPGA